MPDILAKTLEKEDNLYVRESLLNNVKVQEHSHAVIALYIIPSSLALLRKRINMPGRVMCSEAYTEDGGKEGKLMQCNGFCVVFNWS